MAKQEEGQQKEIVGQEGDVPEEGIAPLGLPDKTEDGTPKKRTREQLIEDLVQVNVNHATLSINTEWNLIMGQNKWELLSDKLLATEVAPVMVSVNRQAFIQIDANIQRNLNREGNSAGQIEFLTEMQKRYKQIAMHYEQFNTTMLAETGQEQADGQSDEARDNE